MAETAAPRSAPPSTPSSARPAGVPGPPLGRAGWIAAVAVLAAGPLLFALAGTPFGQSYGYNMAWLVAFQSALEAGAPYPRHLPELMFGLGGLDFFFYGPLPFFLAAGPAAWACPGCAPQTVFGLAGGLMWSASLLAFWPLARRVAPPRAAALACLVYGLLPYHLGIDWGVRQAAGEFAAYIFLPLIARGQIDMLSRGRAGLAFPLGIAGLILSHLPTALLAVHVFGLLALAGALARPRTALPRLAALAGMGLAGAALAGLYWLPALVLVGDVSPAALATPALSPPAWLYFGAAPVPGGQLGAVIALGALAAAAAAGAALAVADRGRRATVALWCVLPVAGVIALNTAASAWLWEHWVIGRVQFPFRLMVFADLAAALAAGVLAAALLRDRAPDPAAGRTSGRAGPVAAGGLGALGLAVAAGLVLAAPRVAEGVARTGAAPRMLAAPEYLPPAFFAALQPRAEAAGLDAWSYPRLVRDNLDAIRAGTVAAERLEIAPRRWHVTPEAAGPALLPVPFWRHMRAETATGTAVALAPDPDWGRVALNVPDGAPAITVTLPRHWSETAGAALSLAGLAACAGIAVALRRRRPEA